MRDIPPKVSNIYAQRLAFWQECAIIELLVTNIIGASVESDTQVMVRRGS